MSSTPPVPPGKPRPSDNFAEGVGVRTDVRAGIIFSPRPPPTGANHAEGIVG